MRAGAIWGVVGIWVLGGGWAQAQLSPRQVPEFDLRVRVLRWGGGPTPAEQKFSFTWETFRIAEAVPGSQWSPWFEVRRKQIAAILKRYPNSYLRRWPMVARVGVRPVRDPMQVEVQVRFVENGQSFLLHGELFGPYLGMLVWRKGFGGEPQVATSAQYNQRYWDTFDRVKIAPQDRPRKFVIVDRYIGLDHDRRAWSEGFQRLARAGFTALMVPPSEKLRELFEQTGMKRIAWAVYAPPGYAFDYDPRVNPESIERWAQSLAANYHKAGFQPQQMALFAMSDEPGWYYPSMFRALRRTPEGLKRFRLYLQQRGLQPQDLGCRSWEEVFPLGPSGVGALESKRLYYWTMRFFPWDSARHFARCSAALRRAFHEPMPVVTNWNFFAGRFFVPGPVANNPDKTHPDASMGGHDWYEYARLGGTNMLWTEDWFGDDRAYQWSFYLARLRTAARSAGLEFGSYVIPRTAGGRRRGITQKVLSIVGQGGKAIKYFVFGPEYVFPGNCYSERVQVLPEMVEAHRAIGRMEELLWPGRMPVPQVALLHSRSSQPWDALAAKSQKVQIQGATNTHMNARRTGYMAELFDLYLALQHANIPADVIDEDMLTAEGLKPYRVLYITGPDLPRSCQEEVVRWVRGGGVVVLVPGAAHWDRYHEPCRLIYQAAAIQSSPVPRRFYANVRWEKSNGKGRGPWGEFSDAGPRAKLSAPEGKVLARFANGQPAVVVASLGQGQVVAFGWWPGLSYWKSWTRRRQGLPVGFSAAIRSWITWPVLKLAAVKPWVQCSVPLVEALVLKSERGVVLTLLNWSGRPWSQVRLSVRLEFEPRRVEAFWAKQVPIQRTPEGVELQVPLEEYELIGLFRQAEPSK